MEKQQEIKVQLQLTTGYVHPQNQWVNPTGGFGYHEFDLEGIYIPGQRSPRKRLSVYQQFVSFDQKTIVDFGCNVGGMLFHLPQVKQGVGLDFDIKCINAANNIKGILNRPELAFHWFDFDNVALSLLDRLLPPTIDYIFLLAIGGWVRNWQDLFTYALNTKAEIIYESHINRDGWEKWEPLHLAILTSQGYQATKIHSDAERNTYWIHR